MAVRARVQKWGNSLAVRLPKALAEAARLENDGEVELTLVDGKLVLAAVPSAITLESLLARITEENLHAEVGTGEPAGNERW